MFARDDQFTKYLLVFRKFLKDPLRNCKFFNWTMVTPYLAPSAAFMCGICRFCVDSSRDHCQKVKYWRLITVGGHCRTATASSKRSLNRALACNRSERTQWSPKASIVSKNANFASEMPPLHSELNFLRISSRERLR